MSARIPDAFDVLVAGGGLPGLVLAAALDLPPPARGGWTVGLVEPRPPRPMLPESPLLPRVLAISPAASGVLRQAGGWDALPESRIAAYRAMRVWQAGTDPFGAASLAFTAAELGTRELGHIIEHDLLREALWKLALARPGVSHVPGALATDNPLRHGPAWTAVLADGAELTARLLVGADGADSPVRAALGLRTDGWSYGQTALTGHVATVRHHDDTAWQCFRPDGPVALLPLPDGRVSFVWSVATARAAELTGLNADAFGTALTAATEGVLGALALTTPLAAFPLSARHTRTYTGARFALVGDAAHQVHPLAGLGANLGILDAAVLAARLGEHARRSGHADPGEQAVLRVYERERKGANLATLATIEALHRAFAGGFPALARLAGLGLGLVDRAVPLKRALARQAMGAGMF